MLRHFKETQVNLDGLLEKPDIAKLLNLMTRKTEKILISFEWHEEFH